MKFLDRFRKNKEPDFFELLTKQAEFINKGIRLLNERTTKASPTRW